MKKKTFRWMVSNIMNFVTFSIVHILRIILNVGQNMTAQFQALFIRISIKHPNFYYNYSGYSKDTKKTYVHLFCTSYNENIRWTKKKKKCYIVPQRWQNFPSRGTSQRLKDFKRNVYTLNGNNRCHFFALPINGVRF